MVDPSTSEPGSERGDAYLLSLASMGLERLQSEPARLQAGADQSTEALRSLCLDHYGVFIVSQDCVRHVKLRGAELDRHLESLLESLEGLTGGFTAFQKEATELLAGHKRNRRTLEHHHQLVELLEVPQLMDACVRNSLYEEAIAVATFTEELERKHAARAASTANGNGTTPPGAPSVVRLIAREVGAALRSLRSFMLQQLRGDVSLPKCLQLVSCLRRVDSLALDRARNRRIHRGEHINVTKDRNMEGALLELRLQVDFLEARDVWLQSVLDDDRSVVHTTNANINGSAGTNIVRPTASAASDPYTYLLDVIEKCRTHWFEIATQYKTLFGEAGGGGGQPLAAWLSRRVGGFLVLLDEVLPSVEEGASLRSLVEQTMSFSASMGRLGADFRVLISPVFESAVRGNAVNTWKSACTAWESGLSELRTGASAGRVGFSPPLYLPTAAAHKLISVNLSASGEGAELEHSDSNSSSSISMTSGVSPPQQLLSYPLLARFVNAVLASLNQLRECAPLSLEPILKEDLDNVLVGIAVSLGIHREACITAVEARPSLQPLLMPAAVMASETLATIAIPHLVHCFCAVFGGSQIEENRFSSHVIDQIVEKGLYERPVPVPTLPVVLPVLPNVLGSTSHARSIHTQQNTQTEESNTNISMDRKNSGVEHMNVQTDGQAQGEPRTVLVVENEAPGRSRQSSLQVLPDGTRGLQEDNVVRDDVGGLDTQIV